MREEEDGSDAEELGDLFPDPEGYYQPDPEPTFETVIREHAENGSPFLMNASSFKAFEPQDSTNWKTSTMGSLLMECV